MGSGLVKIIKTKNHEFFQAAVELLSSSVEAVSRPVEGCVEVVSSVEACHLT